MLLLPLLTFLLVTFGLAWPLAARLALDPAEKLVATVILSLTGAYLLAFAGYGLALPLAAAWALPALAIAGLIAGRREFRATLRDRGARALLTGWLLVTAWCVGWMLMIVSYSGGGWAGDWFEHWERTRFFLERWPLDTRFLGFGLLPARPPLANLITAALLGVGGLTYAGYQLLTALLNCLVFLPAALLARRFQSRSAGFQPASGPAPLSAIAVLAVLLMLNPSFVENATFAWTKLIAAFFILSGLYFFLRAHDPDAPAAAGPLCAVSLAAGLLAHYSAGPYIAVLAVLWCWQARTRGADGWRQTAQLALLGTLLLATWFGWSLARYGVHDTFLSNSSVTASEARSGNQLVKIALNLRDTVVPHFLRTVDPALIAQRSPWGYWRDWFFQLYQVNLLFVFGSVAWLVLAWQLFRGAGGAMRESRGFWLTFVLTSTVLGVAVHGARDSWGLAHICLQALVVLGLAYLAARWPVLGRGWRVAVAVGATVDLVLGIALNFGVQSYAFDRWLAADRPPLDLLKSYSDSAFMNLAGKLSHHLQFLSDLTPLAPALVLALLAVILMLALIRAVRPGPTSD